LSRKTEKLKQNTPGSAAPLGATCTAMGVNFSVYSAHAIGLDLLLFDHAADPTAAQTISLDPESNRTANYWHVFIANCGHGQVYAWRAREPRQPD